MRLWKYLPFSKTPSSESNLTAVKRENSTEVALSPQPFGDEANGGDGAADGDAHEAAVVFGDMREG